MQNPSPVPLRLALYARVSTEEQREGQTIDSQVAELERFSREQCWPAVRTYKDEGWSGAVMARPALDALRDDASKGLFDAVLINDVDRLARDVTHLGILKRDFERRGLRVLFRKLPVDNHPASNFMINILGSFAEFEREQIADRTRRGRRHKIEVRKQYLGSLSSYGYRYIPKNRTAGQEGILEIVPEEVTVVRQMFRWVADEGLSARKVLERLNVLKTPTREGAAQWAKSSVLRILHNEMYTGTWHYNKHQSYEAPEFAGQFRYRRHLNNRMRLRPRQEWLPLSLPESLHIIDAQLWRGVQEQLRRNTAFSPRNEKHRYLLKGLIRCGACLANYVGEPCHGRFYYRCAKRCKGRPSVAEPRIADAVWQAVESAMRNPDVLSAQITKFLQRQRARIAAAQLQSAAVEVVLKQIETEEARLFDAYRAAVINPAQLGRQLEKLAARRSRLEASTRQSENGLPDEPLDLRQAVTEYCGLAEKRMQQMDDSDRQQFLRILVTQVVFEGDRVRIQGKLPVKPDGQGTGFIAAPDAVNGGRIATTESYPVGRNLGRENQHNSSNSLAASDSFPVFEIEQLVVKQERQQLRAPDGRFRTSSNW